MVSTLCFRSEKPTCSRSSLFVQDPAALGQKTSAGYRLTQALCGVHIQAPVRLMALASDSPSSSSAKLVPAKAAGVSHLVRLAPLHLSPEGRGRIAPMARSG